MEYGGGIVDYHNLVNQADGAVLFIGIGGAGISCLKQLKKEVYNHIKPDESMMPEYHHIKFLGIDSENCIEGLRKEDEFVHLEGDINWWIEHENLRRTIKQLNWMNDNLSVYEPGQPRPPYFTYGVRQLGRLLIFLNINKIESIITKKIREALEGTHYSKLYIHIITSVYGGTGSGSVLDICYILKHIIHKLALGARTRVCGFFILPDVLYAKIRSKEVRTFLEVNSFAFFKELDYCMNFELNGGEWEQDYFSFSVKCKLPPVDNAFVLGGNGETEQDTYDNIINYLINSVTNEAVSGYDRGYGRDPILALDQQHSCNQLLCKKFGAGYRYFRLSGAKVVVPYIEINTYIASKLFRDFSFECPTDNDLKNFISFTALSYDELLHELMEEMVKVPSYDVDSDTLFEQIKDLVNDDEYEIPCPKSLIIMKDSYTRIVGEINSKLELYISDVFERIQNELEKICISEAKHPGFVMLLIKNQEYGKLDLIKVFDNYLYKNKSNMDDAYKALAIIRRNVVEYIELMKKTRINRNKNAKSYTLAMHDYYTELVRIEMHKGMDIFLTKLQKEMIRLNDSFWQPFNCITNNLVETYKMNLSFLDNRSNNNCKYTINTVSIDDSCLKDWLDELINNIDQKHFYADYLRDMIDSYDKWSSYYRIKNRRNQLLDDLFQESSTKVDENSKKCVEFSQEEIIKHLMDEFFTNQLPCIYSANIDYLLGLKYKCISEEELSEVIYNDLFKDMLQLSDNSLVTNCVLANSDLSAMKSYTINVPCYSSVLEAACEKLHHYEPRVIVRKVLATDAVYLNGLICCVPLFAIDSITKYFQNYTESHLCGVHLYEKNEH